MPTTVEIYYPFPVDTHLGSAILTWRMPTRLVLVAKHTRPVFDFEKGDRYVIPFAQSVFSTTLTWRAGHPLAVRVRHARFDQYVADHRLPPRIQGSSTEIALMERELARWLEGWIVAASPMCVLASALAHHNAYVRLRDEYHTVPPNRLATHQRRMARCAVRAASAADWMLKKTGRREVREWAVLHYVHLVGRAANTVTPADLCLPR